MSEASFQGAVELQLAGDYAQAEAAWRALLSTEPEDPVLRTNLGSTLKALGRHEEAIAEQRRAVAAAPDFAQAWFNLGSALAFVRQDAEAEAAFRRTLALEPGHAMARLQLSYLLLMSERFAEGWPLFEARRELPGGGDRLELPEWRGEDPGGQRILLWPEQGFGDQIQFARYVRPLHAAGALVRLICSPPLERLLGGLPAAVQPRESRMTFEQPDAWAPLGSLPGLFTRSAADIDGAPYLQAPAEARARWAGFAPNGGVGFVWRGNPRHPNDAARSLPSVEILAPLREAGMRLLDLQEPRGDFADTAAVVEQLDLILTVDTSMAHLAGALGKPCWILLSRWGQDWRWFNDRSDSPWYGSVRLFRQPRPGDWEAVLAEVAVAWRALGG